MDIFDELVKMPENNDRFYGVLTGIVKENWDQDHPGCVKVEYFYGPEGINVSDWMPVATHYAAVESGIYFLPEVESQVVITFLQGDWHSPVVIGTLWNTKTKLPENTAVEKNNIKRIKTKAGHEIIFDGEEGKEAITVTTPKKLNIKLDDEAQTIKVSDEKAENSFTLSQKDGSFEVNVKSKLELKIDGQTLLTLEPKKVSVTADTIEAKAEQTMKLEAQTMNQKGNSVEIKSDGEMTLQAGGVSTIKGSMVKIN